MFGQIYRHYIILSNTRIDNFCLSIINSFNCIFCSFAICDYIIYFFNAEFIQPHCPSCDNVPSFLKFLITFIIASVKSNARLMAIPKTFRQFSIIFFSFIISKSVKNSRGKIMDKNRIVIY